MASRSWASVEGAIKSPLCVVDNRKSLAEIFTPKIEYALESNEFGAIKSACIPIRGKTVQVRATKTDDETYILTYHGYEIQRSDWYPDEDSPDLIQDVLCLSLATGQNGLYGLTVARVEEAAGQYVRTGVFRIQPEDSKTAPSVWICPDSPFGELWDIDLVDEDADEFDLV